MLFRNLPQKCVVELQLCSKFRNVSQMAGCAVPFSWHTVPMVFQDRQKFSTTLLYLAMKLVPMHSSLNGMPHVFYITLNLVIIVIEI